eukprot:TRINITY_DN6496_c0_g1_i2.p1 TRINITY_DN6496_c0_g1~~TRINITY_DN6496_c0_g1_i2.p1  ORF type:complete len:176 (-),score=35.47 TRINITY_DN6496_c0_g1_i2:10-537(-)
MRFFFASDAKKRKVIVLTKGQQQPAEAAQAPAAPAAGTAGAAGAAGATQNPGAKSAGPTQPATSALHVRPALPTVTHGKPSAKPKPAAPAPPNKSKQEADRADRLLSALISVDLPPSMLSPSNDAGGPAHPRPDAAGPVRKRRKLRPDELADSTTDDFQLNDSVLAAVTKFKTTK